MYNDNGVVCVYMCELCMFDAFLILFFNLKNFQGEAKCTMLDPF